MSRLTTIGGLTPNRGTKIRTQAELDRALAEAQLEEQRAPESNGDSLHLKVGNDLGVRISRKWLAPAAAAALSLLGVGGVAYKTGAIDVSAATPVTQAWKSDVDDHVKKASEGYTRLNALETEVGSLRTGFNRLERRWLLQSLSQAQTWLWEAERAMPPAPGRIEKLRGDVAKLTTELEGEPSRGGR